MKINLPIEDVYRDVRYIPAKTTPRFTTLITIHPGISAFHLEIFLQHNTDTDVYIISDNRPSIPNICERYKWKNCDILLREWWYKNKERVKTTKLLFMEYDVLVTTKITDNMFTDGVRALEKFYFFNTPERTLKPTDSWKTAEWWWGVDGDKLPLELKQAASNTLLSIMWYNTNALDFLILERWNDVFRSDITCEIRLPTILNFHKVPLYDWDEGCGVFTRNSNIPISEESEPDVLQKIKNYEPGIYHPVREPVK